MTSGALPNYQVSALLMAIVLRGMTAEETAWLTEAMVASGRRVDLSSIPGIKVGKHSTGGVGDKTSIIVAPLVAACGVPMPESSGRGLGHTGGTIDKLESIPGFTVGLTATRSRAVRDIGCAFVGQTPDIAPADKKLYALRDVTGTVESLPLIASSIMSKKIGEGTDALVLDVKVGRGAFMKTEADARALAEAMVVDWRTELGLTTEAVLTGMDAPLGRAVGNALEIVECLETLKGNGPAALEALCVVLAARLVRLGNAHLTCRRQKGECGVRSRPARLSRRCARSSNAKAAILPSWTITRGCREPCRSRSLRRHAPAWWRRSMPMAVGRASMALGAGRDRVDAHDRSWCGIIVGAQPGDTVEVGAPLFGLHVGRGRSTDEARRLLQDAAIIADTPVPLHASSSTS